MTIQNALVLSRRELAPGIVDYQVSCPELAAAAKAEETVVVETEGMRTAAVAMETETMATETTVVTEITTETGIRAAVVMIIIAEMTEETGINLPWAGILL